jgi:hypothetical protein
METPASKSLIDRLMPEVTEKERSDAQDNFRAFVHALLCVAKRLAAESQHPTDSHESEQGCKIPPTPEP